MSLASNLAVGGVHRRRSSPSQVLAIVCAGVILANLDLFIVNVALPSIGADLRSASLGDLSWILNGYTITYAALLVFCGRFAERHRRDRAFLAGVALFTLASAACAAATSLWSLVAFRVVQAAGAALMTPTSVGLLLAVYAPERRAGAVRTWAAIGGFAAALGPLAGGLLLQANWRWIFLVNVPIGVVALIFGWRRLPAVEGHPGPRPSPVAAVLSTFGIAALTLAILKGNEWGWRSVAILSLFGGAITALALFAAHCLRASSPFIDPALFRIRPAMAATLATAPFSVAFGAMLFSAAIWDQSVWRWSALEAGLAIAPGPLMVPLTSLFLTPLLLPRLGPTGVIGGGVMLFAGALAVWALTLGAQPDITAAVAPMLAMGVAVGLVVPTLMGVGTAGLPANLFTTGSGVLNMVRQAGYAIGVAGFVAILGSRALTPDLPSAFHRGWWVMATVAATAILPLFMLRRETSR